MHHRLTTILTSFLLLAALSLGVGAQYKGAKPAPMKWRSGLQTISVEDARDLVGVLAGPDFRGRSPRTMDYAAAAGYTAALLRTWGLKPAGDDGSYFQRFQTETVTVEAETASLESPDGAERWQYRRDVTFQAPDDVETRLGFAFLRAPKGADLSTLDLDAVGNRYLIIAPDTATNHRDFYIRLLTTYVQGGRIKTAGHAPAGDSPLPLRSVTLVKGIPPLRPDAFLGLQLRPDVVRRIAEGCGANNYLAAASDRATIEACDQEYILKAKVKREDALASFNVVAKLEGSDPVLKDEAVTIGAHLDHFGVVNPSAGVRWGADDNASGVTAALLIARAIARNPVKPRRSVVIGLWAMEETGLHGSWSYVHHPAVPMEKNVAYLNMDQVGRNEDDKRFNETAGRNTDSIYISAVKFNSEDLYNLLKEANTYVGLKLKEDREDRVMRSDTASFYTKGVPTLKAFTGEHPDYHRETDTAEKINYEKLANIARWLYLATMDLTTRVERPRFEKRPFVVAQ